MSSKKTINLNTPLSEEIDISLLKNITMRNKSRTSTNSNSNINTNSNSNPNSSEITNKNYNLEHYNVSICTDSLTNIYINIINPKYLRFTNKYCFI